MIIDKCYKNIFIIESGVNLTYWYILKKKYHY